ncbi:MAG: hypothetical protein LBL57_07395 [Tannerella sp.]|jgi:hypothetical protein|nr:hypothetical protein [Tannerella sp.]
MKRLLNINILAVGFFLLLFSGCIEDPKMQLGVRGVGKPEFEGGAVSKAVTVSTIEVSAKISKANGAEITERGFCYGTEPSPSIENNNTVRDTNVGIGEYTLTITGLSDSTGYYIWPYAINSEGTVYGPELRDTTYSGQASVVTLDAVHTYASKVTVEGRINKTGEGEPGKCGIYYSTDENFEQKDSVETVVPDNDSKIYPCLLSGLTPDTEYYYQAYVRNDYGLSTGDVKSFKTKDGKPHLNPVSAATGYTDARLSSTVEDGGDITVTIVERGFCLREQTADIDSIIPSGEGGVGYFEELIEGLKAGGRYIVKAYAKSTVLDVDDLELTVYSKDTLIFTQQDKPTVVTEEVEGRDVFGGNATVTGAISAQGRGPIIEAGICWSLTNPIPDMDDNYELSSVNAEQKFTVQLTGLKGGVTYYVCAFARNVYGLSYGEPQKFTTPPIFNANLVTFGGQTPVLSSPAYFATYNDGTFYLLGGDLWSHLTAQLWSYTVSDTNNEWKQLKSFDGGAAKWQTGVGYGGAAYVFGGVYEDPDAEIGLYYYAPSPINEWKLKSTVPDTLYSAAGCAYGNSVVFIGGQKDTVKQSVWSYEHGNDIWKKKSDFPVKQYGGFAVVYNNKIYAGMGKDDDGVCNGRLWVSEDGADGWDLTAECTEYHGGIISGVVSSVNRCIYVIDEDYHILEYSLELGEWKEKSILPSILENNVHCMYEYQGKIYIGLGKEADRNSLIVYDPSWDN